jgi:hypothetical protein
VPHATVGLRHGALHSSRSAIGCPRLTRRPDSAPRSRFERAKYQVWPSNDAPTFADWDVPAPSGRRPGQRNAINQLDQNDKERLVRFHRRRLRIWMVWQPLWCGMVAFRSSLDAAYDL